MGKLKVTKKRLQQLLAESSFSPSEAGPLRVIVEQGNADYYEVRAMELVAEARLAVTQKARINTPGGDFFAPDDAKRIASEHDATYQTKMKQAVSLLALARAERATAQEAQKAGA